jgi:very-short-patch-repair endonuclease
MEMPWNTPPATYISPRAALHAKSLRRSLADPEKRLWWALRHRLPLQDSHFRRQVPVGPYVADFCCLSARLIVEVDGNQHGTDAALAYDSRRTVYLDSRGFTVLRFSNAQVTREMDVVLDTIFAAILSKTPTPSPSPQGGGGWEPET